MGCEFQFWCELRFTNKKIMDRKYLRPKFFHALFSIYELVFRNIMISAFKYDALMHKYDLFLKKIVVE